MVREKVSSTSTMFHTFSMSRFSWIITECRYAVDDQPRHEGGVLDRIPGPVAAPAEHLVGPARRRAGCRARGRTTRTASSAASSGSTVAELAGHQRRDRERERHRRADVARCRATAGGSSSSSSAAAGSDPRPRAPATGSSSNGIGDEHQSARKKTATTISVAVTHGISSRLRFRFCSCTSVVNSVEDERPRRAASPSDRPTARRRVYWTGKRARRVRGDVLEREVVAHQRTQQQRDGERDQAEGRIGRVLARADEVGASAPAARDRRDHGEPADQQREADREAPELGHLRSPAPPSPRTSTDSWS